MAEFKNLVQDIYGLFTNPKEISKELADEFGEKLATIIQDRLRESNYKPALRMSNYGKPCTRQLWYSLNKPEQSEPLPPATRMKFLFGDIIEQLVVFMAKVAGHKVTDEQMEVRCGDVRGHIDCRIDDRLVDVKSSSSYGMAKFASPGGLEFDDPFGYLPQLRGYVTASGSSGGSFVAVDKQLGHIAVADYEGTVPDLEEKLEFLKLQLAKKEPPERAFTDEPDGKSGNKKLKTACSYCPFKRECWPEVRTFLYGNGPRFLTVVARPPDVPESKQ